MYGSILIIVGILAHAMSFYVFDYFKKTPYLWIILGYLGSFLIVFDIFLILSLINFELF